MDFKRCLITIFLLTIGTSTFAAEKLSGKFNISTGEIVPYTISHKPGSFDIEGFELIGVNKLIDAIIQIGKEKKEEKTEKVE